MARATAAPVHDHPAIRRSTRADNRCGDLPDRVAVGLRAESALYDADGRASDDVSRHLGLAVARFVLDIVLAARSAVHAGGRRGARNQRGQGAPA
jgi:hypothetical protein